MCRTHPLVGFFMDVSTPTDRPKAIALSPIHIVGSKRIGTSSRSDLFAVLNDAAARERVVVPAPIVDAVPPDMPVCRVRKWAHRMT